MLRSFLLAPCLLICLSCATPTPFPIENLETGMTLEAVREKFGVPIASDPGDVVSSWTFEHEERNWIHTVMSYSAFLPHCIVVTAATMPFIGADSWCDAFFNPIEKKPVVLHFEEEKLVRWEVIEPVYSGYYDPSFPSTMTFPSIDAAHHAKGHTHHHHGC